MLGSRRPAAAVVEASSLTTLSVFSCNKSTDHAPGLTVLKLLVPSASRSHDGLWAKLRPCFDRRFTGLCVEFSRVESCDEEEVGRSAILELEAPPT